KQLDAVQVRVAPDVNFLAFFAAPIPVRKKMQHRVRAPPCLIIIIIIFGEAAGIHDPEVRADARPVVGSGLAAIVESRPRKSAGKKWPGVVIFPPFSAVAAHGGKFKSYALTYPRSLSFS